MFTHQARLRFIRHPFDYAVTRIVIAIFNEGALDTRRRSRQFIPAILAVLAPALVSFSRLSHRSPSREPFGTQIARNAACASSISGRRNPVCSQADPTERSPRWRYPPGPSHNGEHAYWILDIDPCRCRQDVGGQHAFCYSTIWHGRTCRIRKLDPAAREASHPYGIV